MAFVRINFILDDIKPVDILTLLHREHTNSLSDLVKPIAIDYMPLYILFNNGQKFAISNIYHLMEPFYLEGRFLEDRNFDLNFSPKRHFYLCDKTEYASESLVRFYKDKYSVYPVYYIIRSCLECKIIIGAATKEKIDDSSSFL